MSLAEDSNRLEALIVPVREKHSAVGSGPVVESRGTLGDGNPGIQARLVTPVVLAAATGSAPI